MTILFLLRSQYGFHQARKSSWGLSAISGNPRVAHKTEVLKLPIHSGALIGLFANVNWLYILLLANQDPLLPVPGMPMKEMGVHGIGHTGMVLACLGPMAGRNGNLARQP